MARMSDTLRMAGLFAGIGGLDLGVAAGLEESGIQVEHVALVENATFPQEVLAARFPGVPLYDDVTTVTAKDLEGVEVLVGGFPCQDVSRAKKDAAGLAGERSGLWSEQARLISTVQPFFAVIENVEALLQRGLWKVLVDLDAAGYVAQYDVLTAWSVGAPHRRERVFVLAQRKDVFNNFGQNFARFQPRDDGLWSTPRPWPWAEGRDVLPAVKALGNAVVPAVAQCVGRGIGSILQETSVQQRPSTPPQMLTAVTAMPRAGCMVDGVLFGLPSATRREQARGEALEEMELTGTREDRLRELDARIRARRLPTPTATDWKGGGVGGAWHRNLKQGMGGTPSPEFLEWVMGFEQGWTKLR
jgi:DNA (cytosine-5)-methyltransferase 1